MQKYLRKLQIHKSYAPKIKKCFGAPLKLRVRMMYPRARNRCILFATIFATIFMNLFLFFLLFVFVISDEVTPGEVHVEIKKVLDTRTEKIKLITFKSSKT